MQKGGKIVAVLIGAVVVTAVVIGLVNLYRVKQYQNAVANITYSSVDIAAIPDGVYLGECDVDLIRAKVEVTVEAGVITEITLLEHENDQGSAATGLERQIVREQRVDVDAVSGATNSSKVIKKAVDNALNHSADNR